MSDGVSLQQGYSRLNSALTKLFDESGVRRSFTVPFVHGQEMDAHIKSVGTVAQTSGGLSRNLVTSSHHSEGRGWGSGDGATQGHPSEKLRTTIIPKDDENAKASIDAAQKYLNDIGKLLGEDNPAFQTANNQLKLVKKTSGAGMNLFDFGTMLIQLMSAPTQAVAKAHNGTKENGHSAHLRAPGKGASEEQPETQEAPQGDEQQAAPEAQAPAAPTQAAPEAPQPQGQ